MSSRDKIGDRLWPFGRSPALIADPITLVVLFIVAVTILFLAFPGIDVWFTDLFFHTEFGFPMGKLAAFTALRELGRWLIIAAVLVLIAAVLVKLACPTRPTPIRPCDIVFALSSLVIGPGLVVNAFFKEFWGRPRPAAVEVFGGDAPFVKVWEISDHCLSNCSFVSGEASAAIWLVALAMIAPAGWRRIAVSTAIVLAVVLSFNRITFGRHFLSDVLLAWGLTLLLIVVIHRFVVESPPAWLSNDRLEAGLTRIGLQLRRASHPS